MFVINETTIPSYSIRGRSWLYNWSSLKSMTDYITTIIINHNNPTFCSYLNLHRHWFTVKDMQHIEKLTKHHHSSLLSGQWSGNNILSNYVRIYLTMSFINDVHNIHLTNTAVFMLVCLFYQVPILTWTVSKPEGHDKKMWRYILSWFI